MRNIGIMRLLALCCIFALFTASTHAFVRIAAYRSTTTSVVQKDVFQTVSVQHGGITRKYSYFKPAGNTPTSGYPVVFVLHGGKWDMTGMRTQVGWQFEDEAKKEPFIVLYPDATSYSDYKIRVKNDTDGKGHWNDGRNVPGYYSSDKNVDDVGYISFLIDEIAKKYTIDKSRVYVTGFSNGAMMTDLLWCKLSNRIAAIAPVSGTMSPDVAKNCNPTRNIPVLMINGTADPLVTWNATPPTFPGLNEWELGTMIPVPETLNTWLKANNCDTSNVVKKVINPVNDGTLINATIYAACGRQQNWVQMYEVKNGGHTWPQGKGNISEKLIGKTNKDINAGNVIWGFFRTKGLYGTVATDTPASTPKASQYPGCPKVDIVVGAQTWASCNINAGSNGVGTYFQWGRNDTGFNWSSWTAPSSSWWSNKGGTDAQWPCSAGYHVPTKEEWEKVIAVQWGNYQSVATILELPASGYKTDSTRSVGTYYFYWSSTSMKNPFANARYNQSSEPIPYAFLGKSGSSKEQPASISIRTGMNIRCIKN